MSNATEGFPKISPSARIDQIGHRRNRTAALTFDGDERQRRPLLLEPVEPLEPPARAEMERTQSVATMATTDDIKTRKDLMPKSPFK